jgi:glucokinase
VQEPEAVAEKVAVAVDLGATRVRVCVGSKSGRILRRVSRKMVIGEEVEDYLGQVTKVMGHLMKGMGKLDLQGICVASPGPLDLSRGLIVGTSNLPYPEVPIVDAIQRAFNREVYLVNDANAAALGEWLRGAGKGHQNVFYLTISTGIGGGAVVDGKLLLGKEGNAAEVGHITIDSSGRMTCGCGRRGHWEAYCSGRGIPRFARSLWDEFEIAERVSPSGSSLARNLAKADAPTIFRAADRGDKFALQVVAEVGRLNAIGVANVTDAFDPEIVTIGGGVGLNNPQAILPPIIRQVGDYAINRPPEVRMTRLGDDVGLLGALSVAYDPGLIGR